MGNWRTVNILGTISEEDVVQLRHLLDTVGTWGTSGAAWAELWACLCYDSANPGLAALGEWPYQIINAAGNLAERDFSVDDVAAALQALAEKAPSMDLKVHCGGDWESEECVATITVAAGLVATGPPEVKTVAHASDEQVRQHMWRAIGRNIGPLKAGGDNLGNLYYDPKTGELLGLREGDTTPGGWDGP